MSTQCKRYITSLYRNKNLCCQSSSFFGALQSAVCWDLSVVHSCRHWTLFISHFQRRTASWCYKLSWHRAFFLIGLVCHLPSVYSAGAIVCCSQQVSLLALSFLKVCRPYVRHAYVLVPRQYSVEFAFSVCQLRFACVWLSSGSKITAHQVVHSSNYPVQ